MGFVKTRGRQHPEFSPSSMDKRVRSLTKHNTKTKEAVSSLALNCNELIIYTRILLRKYKTL